MLGHADYYNTLDYLRSERELEKYCNGSMTLDKAKKVYMEEARVVLCDQQARRNGEVPFREGTLVPGEK